MSNQPAETAGRSPYWGVPVARAIPAFVVAAYLTFTENHSSQVGLFVFGAFAVVTAVLVGPLSARFIQAKVTRNLFIAQAVVAFVIGVVALVFNAGGVPFFLYIVTLFAALTGFIELYAGLRSRNATNESERLPAKEWIAAGAFTGILALVFLIVPLDIVTAVGLFGGYAVILGIYLVIGGLSLRWGHTPTHTPALSQETTS